MGRSCHISKAVQNIDQADQNVSILVKLTPRVSLTVTAIHYAAPLSFQSALQDSPLKFVATAVVSKAVRRTDGPSYVRCFLDGLDVRMGVDWKGCEQK
jgi:hypothetical protein